MVSVKSLFSRFVMVAASALALSALLTVPLAHADDVTHNSATADFLVSGSLSANASDFVEFPLPFGQQGMRFAVRSVGGEATGTLRLRRDTIDGDVIAESTGDAIQTLFVMPNQLLANRTYYLELQAGNEAFDYDLRGDSQLIRMLPWDDGSGANTVSNPFPGEVLVGDVVYQLATQTSTYGAMRVALDIADASPDYNVLMQRGSLSINNETFESDRVGDDGFVLPASEFGDAQDWYLLVSQREHSDLAPDWQLVAGDLAVTDLGELDPTGSESEVTVGPEGVAYFETTVPSSSLAWQLWLGDTNGASSNHELVVREASAPVNNSYGEVYDWLGQQQMLLVPPYLSTSTYIVGVYAEPGTALALNSKEQPVSDLSFESNDAVTVDAGEFGYKTYQVTVPVDPFGWTIALDPDADEQLAVYARSGSVPNEFYNTGLSEAPSGGVTSSMTLAPPTLTDGVWYITVKGSGAFSATLSNGDPEITDIEFTNANGIVNGVSADTGIDYANRTGWRFFILGPDTSAEQLAALGWQLELAGRTAGTLIAIRRNALPSISQYRNGTETINETRFVDAATALEILQRPAQEDDIYYIGIYNPFEALGGFALTSGEPNVKTLNFNDAVEVVNSQSRELWNFYKVVVPADAHGWEVRLRDEPSAPARFVIRRGQLPQTTERSGCTSAVLASKVSFPQGCAEASQNDWAGSLFEDNSDVGQQLILGMNQGLEPGTYYIGVTRKDVNDDRDLSYTLESTGIGYQCNSEDCKSQVTNLSYDGSHSGSVTAREVAWYRITVPVDTPHWGLSLEVDDNAEAGLAVKRGTIGSLLGNSDSDADFSNRARYNPQKGNEYFYKFPENNADSVRSGAYYVAVIGRGSTAQTNNYYVGAGISNYTLTSGPITIDDRTATPLTADAPLSIPAQSLNYGELKAYQVRVPENALALQAEFTASTNTPWMYLTETGQLPRDVRNAEDGVFALDNSRELVNIANPSGDYLLVVSGNSTYGAGSSNQVPSTYDLEVSIQSETVLDFNSGAIAIVEQGGESFEYFRVDVPEDAEGWELRLRDIDVPQGYGEPFFEVRRGLVPGAPGSTACGATYFYSQIGFPEGCERSNQNDWAGAAYNNGDEVGRQMIMGMNKALEPGTYYIRVRNLGSSPVSYTLESRGIGDQCGGVACTVPVTDLGFEDSIDGTLPAREIGWYRVTVPEGTPHWTVSLEPEGTGAAELAVRQGGIASTLGGTEPSDEDGFRVNQAKMIEAKGNDYFYKFPYSSETEITPGVYYLAVVSRGNSPQYSYSIGSGDVSFTLTSGLVEVTDLTGELLQSGVPLTLANQSVNFGQLKAYKVRMPQGASALSATFVNESNGPYLYVTEALAESDQFSDVAPFTEGGRAFLDQSADAVTVASPIGDYMILVRGYSSRTGGTHFQETSTFDLSVLVQTDEVLAFNNDSVTVMDQAPDTYEYFRIDVPEDADGWELRIHDQTAATDGSRPHFDVRKELLPGAGGDTSCSGSFFYSQVGFWDGCERGGQTDWTGATRTSNGSRVGEQMILGMNMALDPGRYYVRVGGYGTSPISYTLQTRGIGNLCGGEKCAIPVEDLEYQSSAANSLIAREVAWYRVAVPDNTANWALKLDVEGSGEADMAVRYGGIASTIGAGSISDSFSRPNQSALLRQEGDEYFYKFPYQSDAAISSGYYYVAVISRGDNPATALDLGAGSSVYTLTSGPVSIVDERATVITADSPLSLPNQMLDYQEVAFYQFSVPDDALGVEVQMLNRVGQPRAAIVSNEAGQSRMPNTPFTVEGGVTADATNDELVTVLGGGEFALAIEARGIETEATFDLEIKAVEAGLIEFDGGEVSDTLASAQSAFYRVEVPAEVDGAPVLGWKLTKDVSSGSLRINYREGALPYDYEAQGGSTMSSTARQTVVAVPFLTPGTWYLELEATGATTFTLTSEPVRLLDEWVMPSDYNLPIGDSGTLSIDDDGGLALAEGTTDYFQIMVPENNGGLLRLELEAISGDPDFYVYPGSVPTTDHRETGFGGSVLYEYYQTQAGRAYGNLVQQDGVTQKGLEPGLWYVGVKAKGANARYRLLASTGNVQPLELEGGSVQGQLLNAHDFRYYTVEIPEATTNPETSLNDVWYVDVTEDSGDVVVFVRDTLPPGNDSDIRNTTYTSEFSSSYISDWRDDAASYSSERTTLVDTPREKILLPPMEPGKTYYLGVYANSDANFDFGVSTSGSPFVLDGIIDFAMDGVVNQAIAAGDSLYYRIDVPAGASRWLHSSVHSSNIEMRLQIGTIPADGFNAWRSYGADSGYDRLLVDSYGMPNTGSYKHWRESETIYLQVVNNGAGEEQFSFTMNGQFLATEDMDEDGILDAYERYYFNTTFYSPDDDYDGDSLTLQQEFEAGLDPTSSDTDGDTLGDGFEVAFGLDPTDPSDSAVDTDGDKVPDFVEVLMGTSVDVPEANTFETAQMVGTVILTQNGQFGSGSEGDTLITLNDDDTGLWHRQWDRPGLRDPGQGERDFYPEDTAWSKGAPGGYLQLDMGMIRVQGDYVYDDDLGTEVYEQVELDRLLYIDISDDPNQPRWRQFASYLVSYPYDDLPSKWGSELMDYDVVPESSFIAFDAATLASHDWASFGCYDQWETSLYSFNDDGTGLELRTDDGYPTDKAWEIDASGSLVMNQNFYDDCRFMAVESQESVYKVIIASNDGFGKLESTLFVPKTDQFDRANEAVNRYLLASGQTDDGVTRDGLAVLPGGVGYTAYSEAGLSLDDNWLEADEIIPFTWSFEEGAVLITTFVDFATSKVVENCAGLSECRQVFELEFELDHATEGERILRTRRMEFDDQEMQLTESFYDINVVEVSTDTTDSDGDGLLDFMDNDDDNDTVPDDQDAFPLDPEESLDTDGDEIGNNADTDDDNDNVIDTEDAFPLDASESVDTDGDEIGNNADTDDDNDGLLDTEEAEIGTNPLLADTDEDGFSDGDEVAAGSNPTDANSVPGNDEEDMDTGLPVWLVPLIEISRERLSAP